MQVGARLTRAATAAGTVPTESTNDEPSHLGNVAWWLGAKVTAGRAVVLSLDFPQRMPRGRPPCVRMLTAVDNQGSARQTTVGCHSTPTKDGYNFLKNWKINLGEDMEKLEAFSIAGGTLKCCSCHGKHFGCSSVS